MLDEIAFAAHRPERTGTDSIDFYARHGRALHAQAARDSLTRLLGAFRSLRERPIRPRRRRLRPTG